MTALQATSVADPALDGATLRAVEEFLVHEADLLDDRRFEDWAALFTEDGLYWVPGVPGQKSPFDAVSIFNDDAQGRDVRIRHLRHPKTLSQEVPPRTLHVVQNVSVAPADGSSGELLVKSRLLMLEYRDNSQRLYGGRCQHRLRRSRDSFAIAFKRVDLLNCDGFLPVISIPF